MHCMLTKQSQSPSYSSPTCFHPIILISTLQTTLSQLDYGLTFFKWTWLIDGCGWSWPYKGGNSHSLLKNYRCSWCGQTFPPSCIQTVWTPWLLNIQQGPTVCIHFARELVWLLHYDIKLFTTYHPQIDGQAKQTNQEIETYLCIFYANNPWKWMDFLSTAEFHHNSIPYSSTKVSPFSLLHEYEP